MIKQINGDYQGITILFNYRMPRCVVTAWMIEAMIKKKAAPSALRANALPDQPNPRPQKELIQWLLHRTYPQGTLWMGYLRCYDGQVQYESRESKLGSMGGC